MPKKSENGLKLLAFDIEVARVIENQDDGQWDAHLGVTCAATRLSDEDQAKTWYTQELLFDGAAEQMPKEDVEHLVMWMYHKRLEGYHIVTWNGLNFDWRVLAAESGLDLLCQKLAYGHFDMMFQFFCMKGYRLGLDAAAKGAGMPGKTEGMDGLKAIEMWPDQHQEVLSYVENDANETLEYAQTALAQGCYQWVSKKGRKNKVGFDMWLSVEDCLKIREPDTSWMDDPATRESFYDWIPWLVEQERSKASQAVAAQNSASQNSASQNNVSQNSVSQNNG